MYEQTTRINAAIAYFFMWPLMLLAKNNPAFSHPFVRSHAQRSSLFMMVFAVIFTIFHYSKSYFLGISVLGFSLSDIILFGLNIVFFGLMLISSYKAFRGDSTDKILTLEAHSEEKIFTTGEYSEETKMQIIASFLPIIGTFTAMKNPIREILLGRKIGNFFFFLFLFFATITKSFITFPVIFTLIVYIAIFVSTSVFLMVRSDFLELPFYKYIPKYHELEARIHAFFSIFIEFFCVAFGKNKTKNFQDEYQKYLEKYDQKEKIVENFWTHPMIIGLPIINLITIPSFFQKKFHEYQWNIAEWFLLTIFTILLYFFGNIFSLYLLIFPIIAIISEAKYNANIRAPLTSIARNIFIFAYKARNKVHSLQENTVEETIILTDNTKNDEKNLENAMKNL